MAEFDFDQYDLPSPEEIQALYDMIAEERTEEAVEYCHKIFGQYTSLLSPKAQLRSVELRRNPTCK